MIPFKECEGPFPWSSSLGSRKHLGQNHVCETSEHQPLLPSWVSRLPAILQSNPGLQAIAMEAASMDCISFRIPREPSLVSGRVLQHCIAVIEGVIHAQKPLIFKIGYTHDCCWRWKNALYGYAHAKERWSSMLVLWISHEPHGPSMLEAALIEIFKCN